MPYPHLHLTLDANEVLLYAYSDGFTERLLHALLIVDRGFNYYATLRYHEFQQQATTHEHPFRDRLPEAAARAIAALLDRPDIAGLRSQYRSYWDDLGTRFFLFRTAAGQQRIEVEEPYGRGLHATRGLPAAGLEQTLLAARNCLDDLVLSLYKAGLAGPQALETG